MRVEVPSSSPAEALTRSSRRQRVVQPRPVVKKESESEQEQEEEEGEETKSQRSVAATYVHLFSTKLVRWLLTSSRDDSEAATVQDNTAVPPETPKVPTPKAPVTTNLELPPSPAVVTDAIDRQTAAWGKSINETWTSSGVIEHSNALRSLLSSVKAIETLVLLLEGSGIIRQIWPLRYLTTVPAIEAIHTSEFTLNVPDFFILLDGAFWAPFSLWLLTSVFLPLGTAYFFNLKATSTATRSNSQRTNFDPLSFNIARALIAYLVYAKHFSFWNLYSGFTIDKVNASVPGEWSGMLTGTAIGLVGTLYEAILQK